MTRDEARALLSTTPARKSTRSQGASACVSVTMLPGVPWVGIQDTKQQPNSDNTRTTLVMTTGQFRAITTALKTTGRTRAGARGGAG